MKHGQLLSTGNLTIALILLWAGAVRAENWAHYGALPGSKVRIEGTSTMHDWVAEGGIVGGHMELDSSFPLDTSLAKIPDLKVRPEVQVTIPVRSLKSGKSLMDSVMHNAMKQEQHTNIVYRLLEMRPSSQEHKPSTPFQFDATGALTVAGVTRTNTMLVSIEPIGSTKLKVSGSTAVKMTDFGITPPAPKLALGAIKTGDDVKIFFEWLTAQRKEAAIPEKAP
jgi:polyisoprenoid-binding protein YceI